MKNLVLLFIMIFLISFIDVHAQFTDAQKSGMHYVNEMSNGGAEYGKVNWSQSGAGTLTADTGTKLRGKASIKFVSAGSDYVRSAGVSCNSGPNCLIRFFYKTTSSNFTAYVYDAGGNIINSLVLPSNTEFQKAELSFVAATPTTLYHLRVVDGNAGSDTVYIDEGYLGANDNIGSVAQAEWVGKITFGSNCDFRTTSTTRVSPQDASCTITTTGNINSVAGYFAFNIPNALDGKYVAVFGGSSGYNNSTTSYIRFAWAEGATSSDALLTKVGDFYTNTGTGYLPTVTSSISKSTTNNYYLQVINVAGSGGAGMECGGIGGYSGCDIDVYRFPSQTQQVVKADVANQFAATVWKGALSQSITSLTFVNVNASGADSARTNYGAATTQSTANDIALKIPSLQPGKYLVFYNGYIQANWNDALVTCDVAITDGTTTKAINTGYSVGNVTPAIFNHGFAYFEYTSVADKTFTLQVQRKSSGSASNDCGFYGTSNSGLQVEHTLTVIPVTPKVSMPQIVNSIYSDYQSKIKRNLALLNCDGGSAITNQLGSWITSIGNISSGTCAVTLPSGIFATTPYCSCTDQSLTLDSTTKASPVSATSITIVGTKPSDGTALTSFDCLLECSEGK